LFDFLADVPVRRLAFARFFAAVFCRFLAGAGGLRRLALRVFDLVFLAMIQCIQSALVSQD
jgi:hypothetical protein